jgi:hypothetical protein
LRPESTENPAPAPITTYSDDSSNYIYFTYPGVGYRVIALARRIVTYVSGFGSV